MRNKIQIAGACFLVALLAIGCTLTQVQTSAQVAGNGVAVGWIAAKDPDTNTLVVVSSLLEDINENAGLVGAGATYTAVVYPILLETINTSVDDRYKPLAMSASITILGGIDMLFAANPEWKEQEAKSLAIVQSFIFGAQSGLAMAIPSGARALDNAVAVAFANMRDKLRENK